MTKSLPVTRVSVSMTSDSCLRGRMRFTTRGRRSCCTIGASALHENAFWNSGMFATDAVDAVAARRVRVGLRLQPLVFRPPVFAPDLRPTQEHALLGREAVDRLCAFFAAADPR